MKRIEDEKKIQIQEITTKQNWIWVYRTKEKFKRRKSFSKKKNK